MTVSLLAAESDEQEMLVDTTARFIAKTLPLDQVRQMSEAATGIDPDYYRRGAELGWFGLLLDDGERDDDRSAPGLLEAAAIAAERGALLQPGPFVGTNVVVFALSVAGSPTHGGVLGELAEGSAVATWIFPTAQIDAEPNGEGWLLNGTIDWVQEANECTTLLIPATGAAGQIQALVRSDTNGLTVRRIAGLDITRGATTVELRDVFVDNADLVGTPGEPTAQLVERQVQIAAVLSAAETVGAMDSNFNLALEYAKDRIAFGRPIGSFQAIKHMLADTSLTLEMSKGLVAAAAAEVASHSNGAAELAHCAKAFVAQRSIDLTHTCFQIFGGIGYTWEHDHHLFMRRIASDAQAWGSAEWHRRQLSSQIGDDRGE